MGYVAAPPGPRRLATPPPTLPTPSLSFDADGFEVAGARVDGGLLLARGLVARWTAPALDTSHAAPAALARLLKPAPGGSGAG